MFDAGGRFRWRYGSWGTHARQLRKPGGVCVDTSGRVYVADVLDARVHVVGADGKLIGHVPYSVCGGFFYVKDYFGYF